MPPQEVVLKEYEIRLAVGVGCHRNIESLLAGRQVRYGADQTGWNIHIEGAGGELAVAKYLGLYWNGSANTFQAGDVGKLQVRTRSVGHYELIIRPSDRDDDIFVLVVGRIPIFNVIGWIYGREGKRPQWKRTYGGRPAAWFVPHGVLRRMDSPTLKGN